jgi:hypothetical protein
MNSLIRVAVVCFVAVLSANAFAGDGPLMGKPGKMLFEDDFSAGKFGPMWKVGKGFWTFEDGKLRAAENPDDHHGAYSKADFPYKDIVTEFSFKFDGSPNFNFTMDDHQYKGSHAGHICRVQFSPKQVQFGDSKFGGMRNEIHDKMQDPKTTAEEKKAIQASIKDKTANFKTTIDPAKWHEARVEIVGDEMLVSVDGKPVGYHKSEGYDHPTKNLLGFTVSGKSTLIDNFKVWEATAAPDWAAHKAEVVGGLGK